jgi:multimeric flavodoxin WrbA
MKVIGIGGSPRKGNSEWMLQQLAEELKQRGAEVEILLLRQLDIKRCTGCLKCEDRSGKCTQNDIMNTFYPRLLEADTIVMASPVYFEMISALLKNFIDRTCPVWTKLEGKSLAGLVVAEEGIGQTMRNIQQYGKVCGMQWAGGVSILAKTPHDAGKNASLKKKLHVLAGKIMSAGEG